MHMPSSCRLRCSQSCLEQSLFRYFGPDSGQSVCLRVSRVLKVLRDISTPPVDDEESFAFGDEITFDHFLAQFDRSSDLSTNVASLWMLKANWDSSSASHEDQNSRWISSYALKTLLLLEWEQNPGDQHWAGSSLAQRVLNIVEKLFHCL